MGKISLVSAKYIIHATIGVDGMVDKPDVIGAIFGQTEGLLGSELELRELQRSGRIGRIEVDMTSKQGKTSGSITIPSSLDMAEISIVGAALEIIQRIGPCNAKIQVQDIEDVRVSKRQMVVERAKELLKNMIDKFMPDSQEIAEEVAHSVRMFEIKEYGADKLPCGPMIDDSDEVILVEGRADVLNLLKYGIKNVIAMNGSIVPKTIIDLSKQKVINAFLDGDRGGDLNLRELLSIAEIDFVSRAPDGKEVEELTKKEIHKAIRSKVSVEQIKMDLERAGIHDNQPANENRGRFDRNERNERFNRDRNDNRERFNRDRNDRNERPERHEERKFERNAPPKEEQKELNVDAKKHLKAMLEEIIGSKGAYLLSSDLKVLGKVPVSELLPVIENADNIDTIVFDGAVDEAMISKLEQTHVTKVVAMAAKGSSGKIAIMTAKDFANVK